MSATGAPSCPKTSGLPTSCFALAVALLDVIHPSKPPPPPPLLLLDEVGVCALEDVAYWGGALARSELGAEDEWLGVLTAARFPASVGGGAGGCVPDGGPFATEAADSAPRSGTAKAAPDGCPALVEAATEPQSMFTRGADACVVLTGSGGRRRVRSPLNEATPQDVRC